LNRAEHYKVVELAVPALPAASRAFWQPWLPEIVSTCELPDVVAIPLLNGEDGPWRHYFPEETPLHSFEKVGASARAHFFDVRFSIECIMSRMAGGDLPEACHFLGVLSHYLGDYGEPAHYYERDITLLLPPPPDRLNCNPHRLIEDVPSTVTRLDYSPRVLGDSTDTIVLRLEGRLRDLYETVLATIIPILNALYRRDMPAASRQTDRAVAATAEVMADVLHTLACLHLRQWTPDERHALAQCRLDELEPAACDVEFNFGCRPLRGAVTLDKTGRAQPLQLRIPEGTAAAIRPAEGLCVVPHALPIRGTRYLAALEYDLPPDAFTRLTATAGLLAGVTPQAECIFAVETDGTERFRTRALREADPAQPLSVDITGCRRLRLVVYTDGSTDKLAFPIWAWPTVSRLPRTEG